MACWYVAWLILATAGLGFITEVILWAAGVMPARSLEDPYVGFRGTYPLFEPSEPGGGVLQTAESKLRFFNYQSFPREKAPGTIRVFCLGGSTTFGRPYADGTSYAGWLRETLPAADTNRHWEVINAGGISYASYRIAVLMEELIRYAPDVFIIYTGHNEFLEARTYGRSGEDLRPMASLRALAGRTRMYTLAKEWIGDPLGKADAAEVGALLSSEVQTRLDQSVGPADYHRAMLQREETLAHFRFNLNRMITLAEGAGAKVVLVAPASNLRDCSPFKSEHQDGLSGPTLAAVQALQNRGALAIEQGNWAAARSSMEEASHRDPAFAELWFQLGRCYEKQGALPEARAAYTRAKDEDVCPLRAPSSFVDAVRSIATERNVALLDIELHFATQANGGMPGKDLFLDHVHPTIAGHQHIATALIPVLATLLDRALPEDWEARIIPKVARKMDETLQPEDQASALRNLAQVLSWAGKFEEARNLAEACIALQPGDAEAHAIRGWTSEHSGANEIAIEAYGKALDLNPDHLLAIRRIIPLLSAVGNDAEARTRTKEALQRRPADPELQEYERRFASP